MSAHCCAPAKPAIDPRFRKALWIALIVNAGMFFAELAAAASSGSVSLLANSIDFLGDAANYALSLAVLGMAASAPRPPWSRRSAGDPSACSCSAPRGRLRRTASGSHPDQQDA